MNPNENSEPIVVALDFGTSSVRALLFDTRGDKRGDVQQEHYEQTTTVDGGVETDAGALFELCLRSIDAMHDALDRPVLAVAASCFWHSMLAVDGQGRALTPLYSWADNRAAAWIGPLRAMLDEEEVHARTGCVFHTSYWPAKLLWLHQTRGELFVPGVKWMSFGEYFQLKITGRSAVSLSMASGTGLFDQTKCDWDAPLLAALPIGRENLSELCDFADGMAPLLAPFAARWPKLKDARWFPPLGDGACSNVGSGGVDARRFVINVGTSGAVRIVLEKFDAPPPQGLWRYRLDRRRSVVGGAVSNAGNLFAWAQKTLALPDDAEKQLAAMAPDAHGLTVLPFLAGERSPLWNADARYVAAGANLDTTPMELLGASLEGASLRFAVVADLLREAIAEAGMRAPREIVASGGALDKSPAWRQIMCNALGVPITESREPEASARGAALMALEACGKIGDIADLPAELGEPCHPVPEATAIYAKALARQNSMIEKLLGDVTASRRPA